MHAASTGRWLLATICCAAAAAARSAAPTPGGRRPFTAAEFDSLKRELHLLPRAEAELGLGRIVALCLLGSSALHRNR